jgi:DNA-binding response OmpR family regulator
MDIDVSSVGAAARVLVVDDDPMVADLATEWIEEKWACETAYGGAEALETVSEETDLVLLDRQMPERSGEAVLESIREQGYPVQVMMVSGVDPDVDLIDLPIDEYLRKPIDRLTLQEKVEELLLRRTYHRTIREYFVCAAKLAVLERAKPVGELEANDRYLALRTRADELRQSADATLGEMSDHVADFHAAEGGD